jgi:hypothetical protein
VAELVEFAGRDARDDVWPDHVEHLGGQAPGLAHGLLLGQGFGRHGGVARQGTDCERGPKLLHLHRLSWAWPAAGITQVFERRETYGIKRARF